MKELLSMKRNTQGVALAFFGLAAATMLVWWALTVEAQEGQPAQVSEPGVVQFLVRTTQDVKVPPACLVEKDGACTVDLLAKAIVHVRTPVWAYGDAWTTWQGKAYHAHVWRVRYNATYYVWMFEGARAWWYKARVWASKDPTRVGPVVPLPAVPGHAACATVGQALLVNVTRDGGGGLVQPAPVTTCTASDAGAGCTTVYPTWPDGSVANCGGKWWLVRNRYGGSPVIPWRDVDAGALLGPSSAMPEQAGAGQDPAGWGQPDAALYKMCTVPGTASCP